MTDLPGIPTSRAQRIMIGLALAVGVALRLRVYLANRSLWLDESLLAVNLVERGVSELVLQPLANDQAAPVGFLLAERLMVVLFGSSEYALRAFPLLAGIASLFLFWRLAAALLPPVAVTTGVTIFAISELLIYYAAETKQYGFDVAATLILWILFVKLDPALRTDHRGAWALAAGTGAVALWFSHPALFVLGGIGLRWLWHTLREFTWRSAMVRGAVALVWAGSFAAEYVLALRLVTEGTSQQNMWVREFAPLIPSSLSDVMWYVRWARTFAILPLGGSASQLVALTLVVGVVVLWQRRRDQIWWITGAVALAWMASVVHLYPLVTRLYLFCAPPMILLVAAATDEVWRRTRESLPVLAPALAILILAQPALTSVRLVVQPPGKEEVRPLLHHVRGHRREGDRLYVYYFARYAVGFYSARGLGVPGEVIIGVKRRGKLAEYERDAEVLKGGGRTWILFSHVRRPSGLDEEALMLQVFDRFGVRLEERRETGASVYLYDFPIRSGVTRTLVPG